MNQKTHKAMKNKLITWLLSLKAVQEHLATQPDETQQAIDEIVERARDIVREYNHRISLGCHVEVLKDLRMYMDNDRPDEHTSIGMVYRASYAGIEIVFRDASLLDYEIRIREQYLPFPTNPAKPLKSQIDYMLQKFPKHLFV